MSQQMVRMLERLRDAIRNGDDIREWPRAKRIDCAARLNALVELVADLERPAVSEGTETDTR
jgi:hypothetical protein